MSACVVKHQAACPWSRKTRWTWAAPVPGRTVPLTPQPAEALDLVDEWLARPQAAVLHPGDRHASILRELVERAGAAGDLTSDAHLAAIAIEHGAKLATFDTDFHRFHGLRLDYLG